MKSSDVPPCTRPMAASVALSSTTMISKFCMLCAVGAHRAASRIARRSPSAGWRSGSNGTRSEWRLRITSLICVTSLVSLKSVMSPLSYYVAVGGGRAQDGTAVDHGTRHPLAGDAGAFESDLLDDRPRPREQAESQGALRIATHPAVDSARSDQKLHLRLFLEVAILPGCLYSLHPTVRVRELMTTTMYHASSARQGRWSLSKPPITALAASMAKAAPCQSGSTE